MEYDDYVECMRYLTEEFLPHITEHAAVGDEQQMANLFYQVNKLRRASKDAVYIMLEMEQRVP